MNRKIMKSPQGVLAVVNGWSISVGNNHLTNLPELNSPGVREQYLTRYQVL